MSTNAPWARLTMFITPQTSENPTATSASRPPWSSPLTVAWRNWVIAGRSAGRPLQLRLRLIGRVDRHRLPVLDLDRGHRLVGVLAGLVELDRPEERLRLEPGDRVAHLGRIGRLRLLDAHRERQACGGGLGAVVLGRLAESLLEALRVVLGSAEHLVLALRIGRPLRRADHALGVLA